VQVKDANPRFRCRLFSYSSEVEQLDPVTYSEQMMDAKISLCPRGNFPETFRLFESARAGCVIISEPLPPTWYFREHPALVVSDWCEMPRIVASLLQSPDRLAQLHRLTLLWWQQVVGEAAVGAYIAERILSLLDEGHGG
jgi:hypothetical protein